jgi:HSP20 family molecular chaperone IbpA
MAQEDNDPLKSALQDNIERKGGNAYYFAHAHEANGPAWDGKAEPQLISRSQSQQGHLLRSNSTFDYQKSNIRTYAFLDEEKKVKLYIDMAGIEDRCTNEDITLDYTDVSLSLLVRNLKEEEQCLTFSKLSGKISAATFRRKKDKLIVTLTKSVEGEWNSINDKGAPDHEVV